MNTLERQLVQKIAQEFWAGRIQALKATGLPPVTAPGEKKSAHRTPLPVELTDRIAEMCNHSPVLIYAFYSAGFALLLRKYLSLSAVAWGSTVFQGSSRETLTPLIHALEFGQGDQSFKELFSEHKEQLLKAHKYQHTEALSAEKGDPAALLQRLKTIGFLVEGSTDDDAAGFFDSVFSIKNGPDGRYLDMEVATGLLDGRLLPFFGDNFVGVLQQVVERPYQPLESLTLLSPQERELLLTGFNPPFAGENPLPDKTLVELFRQQVRISENETALIFGTERYTYGELEALANRLSAYLSAQGVQHGDLVGIQLERGPGLAVSMLAILQLGAAYVPIDPDYPADRRAYLRDDSQCRLVIEADTWAEFLANPAGYSPLRPDTVVGPDDLAYVLYTSGSTGRPKGCRLRHRGVVNRIDWMWHELGFQTGERVLQKTTFTFDVSVWEFFLPLCWGNTMVMGTREDSYSPDRLLELIETQAVNTLHFVPSMFKAFLSELESRPDVASIRSLKRVITSGEALSPAEVDRWYRLTATPLVNLYGPTEASIDVTWYLTRPGDREIPIGRPIRHTEMYVLDEHRRLLPVGVSGEICIGGVGLSTGYLNRPELTAEKFVDHPFKSGEKLYRTGDLGKWRADGELLYQGRFDHQVKIRGYRIELGEIENALLEHPSVRHAVVAVREGADGDKQLVAYYVAEETLPADTLKAHLSATLPEYMVPVLYRHLTEMPQTASGKVDRGALPEIDDANDWQRAPYVAPANPVEAALVQIWQEILGDKRVGIHDNFFALGGDSIKGIQVVSRLRAFNYTVSVRKVLQHPVLADLAPEIRPVTEQIPQTLVTGEVALNPIQRQFFAAAADDRHYFNQSVLLKSSIELDLPKTKKVFDHLTAHHDALRMVFREEDGVWRQYNRDLGEGAAYALRGFDYRDNADGYDRLVEQANRLEGEADLGEGPLLRVGLFRLAAADYLFLVVHHLVIDGVSWRILIEDLHTLFGQIEAGKSLLLPLKTHSFQTWTRHQLDAALTRPVLDQRAYWERIGATAIPPIPQDHPGGTNRTEDAAEITVRWNAESTRRLTQVNTIYRTDVPDLLLAALVQALRQHAGNRQFRVYLEGHGREALGKDLDVSRTVGWFTSMYPVLFDGEENAAPADTLIEVKESLRNVPDKGIGYGMLQYLQPGSLPAAEAPEILFNYWGEIGSEPYRTTFEYANELGIRDIGPRRERQSVLELNGIITGGCLEFRLSYSTRQFEPATIEGLCRVMEDYLQTLQDQSAQRREPVKTPSDFTYKSLSARDLAAVTRALGPIEDVYPLSPMQEGIYFHWRESDAPELYLEQFSYRLQGDLQAENLEKSYAQLVRRHAILRTCFRTGNSDLPLQFVCEKVAPQFHLIDLSAAATDAEDFIRNYKANDKRSGFDLSRGSQMRLTLIKIAEGVFECIWSHHHILLDGWSFGLLTSEFFELYTSLHSQRTPVLPPIFPYAEYIHWLGRLDLTQTHGYWKKYLEEYTAQAALPKLPVAETDGKFQRRRESTLIPAGDFAALQRLGVEHGVTQNVIFNALWGIILGKLNNTRDVVFGSVLSGRPSELEGIENMLGLFINTIPMRVRYDDRTTFLDLLQRLQREALDSDTFHYAQLADLQAFTPLGSALFDHFILYQNYPVEALLQKEREFSTDVQISQVEMYEQTNYDIIILAIPGEELEIRFDFNGNVYSPELIRRVGEYYRTLVAALIRTPQAPIRSVEMLSAAEKHRLLVEFNATDHPYPADKTLVDLFEATVRESAEKTAVVFEDRQLSFQELNRKVNQLAHFLREAIGLKKGQCVGVFQGRNEYLPVSLMAVVKAGGAYVPLDPDYPEDRLLYMLEDAGIDVLLTEKRLVEFANRLQWRSEFVRHLVCVDSPDVYAEQAGLNNDLMSKTLWDHVGDSAGDIITGGGWMSSYTGERLSEIEMEEYAQNTWLKLKDHLRPDLRVLEIGCSSGITMFRIAPHVGSYVGTDLSSAILEKTAAEARARQQHNIHLLRLPAHEIDQVDQGPFDLIIINSVIHCFNGHNYLREVLNKSLGLLTDQGMLYLGDLIDEEKRTDLIRDLRQFKQEHPESGYRTKTDWSAELFVAKDYLRDFFHSLPAATAEIGFSDKIHTVGNELTRYRFDALVRIDKTVAPAATARQTAKYQHDQTGIQRYGEQDPAPTATPSDLAYVLYTSGSTGKPKGCMLEHGGVVNRIDWQWQTLGFQKDEAVLQKTTFTFDVSVWEFFLPLCWGAKMVICAKEDIASPARLLALIAEHKINCLHFVPSMFKAFLAEIERRPDAPAALASLKRVITSGEALPAESVRQWYRFASAPVHNLYGPTEASIDVSYFTTGPNQNRIPIGKPIWNTRLYVLGRERELLPIGASGEICIGGAGLARGYLNRDQLTAEKFVPHPFLPGARLYRTGDLGQWLPDGNLLYQGRLDDQVKIRGYRIELGEIENALEQHRQIEASALLIRENEAGEKDLIAYYTAPLALEPDDLRQHLLALLPAYMVPAFFVWLEEMPLTPSGKVNRHALPDFRAHFQTSERFEAPATELETELAALWQQVLGVQQIGAETNFFNTGGDSIRALRLLTQVNRAFAVDLTIAELYAHPTIRELAGRIAAQPRKDEHQLEDIQREVAQLRNEVLRTLPAAEAARVEDVYPLSEIEKGMVYETIVSENAGTFHDQFLFEVGYKNFHLPHAVAALELLIRKHARLRTLYNLNDYAEELNVVYGSVPADIDLIDLRDRSKAEQEQFIRDYLAADLGIFQKNIDGGVLWKLSVALVDTDKQIFIWQFHNAFLDGWSTASFLTELNNLYAALRAGNPVAPAPLKATHKDFVLGELYNKRSHAFRDYWIKEMEGYKRLAVFAAEPTDEECDVDLGPELYQRVSKVARQFDTHIQTWCFLAYLYTLRSLTYEDDLTVGLVSNTRPIMEDGDKILGCFLNTLPFRIKRWKDRTWADLIREVNQRVVENGRHQLSLLEASKAVPGEEGSRENPFFDTYFNFTDFHIYDDLQIRSETETNTGLELEGNEITNTFFDFTVSIIDQSLHVGVAYIRELACGMPVRTFVDNFARVLKQMVDHPYALLNSDYLSVPDRTLLLETYQGEKMPFPDQTTLSRMFEAQVRQHPDAIAVVDAHSAVTYRELDERANQLARLLLAETGPRKEQKVGVLHSRGIGMMTAILGILKSGGAYVPLDPDNPEDRLLFILEDAGIETLITEKGQAEFANRLQWRSKTLRRLVCIDSPDFYREFAGYSNELMRKELWDHVGETTRDSIAGGGWMSSYTGADLTPAEMEEYTRNVWLKLKDHLHPQLKVLEIGCSSGLTLFQIAPHVGAYYGTDLSSAIVEKTAAEVARRALDNTRVHCLAAHEIDRLAESDFDLVIINSVIHCFDGHNYLRDVLAKASAKLKPQGWIFLGDLMDEARRTDLVEDLRAFKAANEGRGFRTKTDWSAELFVDKAFLEDLRAGHYGITTVTCTPKTGLIENELTRYRFDALLKVDKTQRVNGIAQSRRQFDLRHLRALETTPPDVDLQPTDLCYVIYTSGSTGRPKGCLLEHRGVINRIEWQWHALGFQAQETVLQKTTFSFDVSVWEIFLPLCWGNKMVVCTAQDIYSPHLLLDLIERHGVVSLHFVPSMFKAFLETLDADRTLLDKLASVGRVITSGEALTPESVKQWYRLTDIPLFNLYGPTEASIDVTCFPTGPADTVIPIGRPIWNTEIHILGAGQQLLPPGVPGEICIGGIGVARGYLNRPELTAEKFIAHPFRPGEKLYRTGDLGRWNEKGEVLYLGRFDSQVKIRGYRIELGEIENALENYGPISAAAVITQTNDAGETDLYAYYSGREAVAAEPLRAHLAERIPAYMIPAHFIFLPELPLTSSGKVDKKVLPSFTGEMAEETAYVSPANETQEKIEKIWCSVLGLKRISVTADFFSIGGDSIKALRLLTQVNKTFSAQLRVADLYNRGTIEGLAELLGAADNRPADPVDLPDFSALAREVQAASPDGEIEDAYPMSDAEKGMVVSSMLTPEVAVFHTQFVYEVPLPDFQPAVFERAFALLIAKHPKLRASYNIYDFSEPVCLIHRTAPVRVQYLELNGADPAGQQAALRDFLEQERTVKFELHTPALWRLTVFHLPGQDKKVIVWQFHHTILDGWGSAAFITELSGTYQALTTDARYQVAPLAVTYKDYIAYEVANNRNPENIDFWKKEVAGFVPLDLFSEEEANVTVTRKFGLQHYRRLKRLAAEQKTTVSNICFAAYLFVIRRLRYGSDLMVGLVTDNRPPIEDVDRLLGCFVKAVPFRYVFEDGDSWKTLVEKVERKAKLLRQFPLTLFEIKKHTLPAGNNGNPFFDTMFNFMDFHTLDDVVAAQETEAAEAEETSVEVDGYDRGNTFLDLAVNVNSDSFGVYISQWRKLHSGISAEALLDEYCRVLETMLAGFNEPVRPEDFHFGASLPEVAPAPAPAFPDDHLLSAFVRWTNAQPEAVALRFGEDTWNYRELDDLANRFAHFLRQDFQLAPEAAVCVSLERGPWYVVAMLGILKGGGTYVPLDPSYPQERLDYLRTDSGAQLTVEAGVLAQFLARVADFPATAPDVSIPPHSLAYIIYTSGTTGKPKGVMVEHRNVCRFLETAVPRFGWDEQHRIGAATNFTFDISVLEIFGSLCFGKELCLYPADVATDPEKFIAATVAQDVDTLQFTPSRLRQIMTVRSVLPASVTNLLVGGEAMDEAQYQWVKQQPRVRALNVYGPTETTIWSASLLLNSSHALSIGQALPGESIHLLDEQGYRLPRGVEGELCIAGSGVARGYRNRPELTAQRFVRLKNGERVYKTGDMGRLLPDGNLEFRGRRDNQVKIRGYRIELEEIAATLGRHPSVQAAAVLAHLQAGEQQLVAYYAGPEALPVADLKQFLAVSLPEYMIPAAYVHLDRIPLSSNGKVDRQALLQTGTDLQFERAEYVAPGDETEERLAAIWQSLLGVAQIGVLDNFFSVGGNSLHVVQLLSRINREFKVKLNLEEVFTEPTVRKMAESIHSLRAIAGDVEYNDYEHDKITI